ncbi:barstar family protein [Polyangium sorediatum]|uniref:Barstar family protein n=1 Tax=Polyangium sorediatum TaxID=889274 RepID=A0ABT6P7S8_9BACT|nr:barstar family protein [Polyangium sorediatum]MDI1436657.1 barstar family protein [Polyangium sorediatum]
MQIGGWQITNETSCHRVFADAFGFPGFYGCNRDAFWIDCMCCLDAPEAEMSSVCVASGELLIIQVSYASRFRASCPKVSTRSVILERQKSIAAIKYLRAQLGCSLSAAKDIVDAVQPWWPRGRGARPVRC